MTYRGFKRTGLRAAAGTTSVLVLAAAVAASGAAAGGSGGVGSTDGGDPSTTTGDTTTGGDPTTTTGDGVFPIRGRHTYGDGLGAGRGHQGQDLIADCGKRVVAAQPGRVQRRGYEGGAGNYVIIDGRGERLDAVYMHLQRRAAVRKRSRVEAGETIGRVGSTGRASTCHLHFELWSEPGAWEGGDPVDPEPSLRRWDASS